MTCSDKCAIGEASLPDRPGVYKLFLANPDGVAHTELDELGEGALLYVGKAKDRLRHRIQEHLRSDRTGFSTLRRSLGAVLADKLKLTARPRRKPPGSDRDLQNYCFNPDGEKRLTYWILDNLEVCWMKCASGEEAKKAEIDLIRRKAPALNITDNPSSPYPPIVRRLRKRCQGQARCDP